ncbi:MAG: hypothetical protein A2X18_08925 [Bacteroidetes bacterium GWF2_40_14]|nr:MAG: hypothetical protein A2X18_08925 [Bacteroidetes bacterium GWF2_40_14]
MYRLKLIKMHKVKRDMLVSLLFFYVIVGIVVGVVLYYFYPDKYFVLYPVIPGYFTLLGIALNWSLIFYKRKDPKKLINVYMMLRGLKFLITVSAILLYSIFGNDLTNEFSITTIGFYFFYLFIETILFLKFEKERIRDEKKN